MPCTLGSIACWTGVALGCISCAQAPRREGPPPFLLDHVGCVVEADVINAVAMSAFVKDEFAHVMPFEAMTSSGTSWSNHTIWGEVTYIELLTPASAEQLDLDLGDCFLALHADQANGVQWLADHMGARHPESNPRVRLRELVRGGQPIPWAYLVTFDYPSSTAGFGVWAKETHPEFKHRMAPSRNPEPGDISRRRNGPAVAFHAEKYFRNVTGMQVVVSARRASQLGDVFRLIGMTPQDRGASTVWTGTDFQVEIAVGTDAPDFALRSIRLRLNRPKTGQRSYQLGPSMRLRFGEGTEAFLDFGR